MEEQITVHIISHTHWDREWFLNSPFTNEWLLGFFDSLFTMLEKEPEYRFILDGQTLMIEDYLDELEKQGRNKQEYIEKIERYAKEKRLLPGPYYLQPDWQLVSGESLIRNLLIGTSIALQFGACMRAGWLLDNFGQISQTVQIHKSFGLKGLFVWRGVEMDPKDVKLEFLWESPDGSVLTAIYLLDSYRNAMRMSELPGILEERIVNEIEKLKPFATTQNILLMNGYDQETMPDDILPFIKSAQSKDFIIKQSSPEEFIAEIEAKHPVLPKLKGALYSGRFISVFPGILSARMYLKILNDKCQRSIEKNAEPVATLSWMMGNEYSQEFLTLWKLLLKNHPHDSIGGVSIDDVHSDMERRLEETYVLSGKIIENELGTIASLIDTSKIAGTNEAYIVFNPSLAEKEAVITIKPRTDADLVVDDRSSALPIQKVNGSMLHIHLKGIPACGYVTFYLISSEKSEHPSCPEGMNVDEEKLLVENQYFTVQVNDDGSLDILDKLSMITYRGLGVFEDGADAGDTYSYSPALHDSTFLSSSRPAEIDILENGPIRCVIRIKITLRLPEGLAEDRKTRSTRLRVFPIVSFITIDANSPLIKIRTLLKNTVKDHRLRVLFPTEINTGKSYAETQFDVVEHEIHPDHYDDNQIPDDLKRVLLGAREPEPITSFPQQSFVDLTDGRRGFALLNRGLPEYEIIGNNNTIALTLFRSIGWLARGDLLTRTGDAGPTIYTPEAQCLREMEFNYALYFHKGDWREGKVHQYSEQFNSECLVVRSDSHPGELPAKQGFLKLESTGDALKLTALKRSEDGEGIILRCYNPSDYEIEGVLTSVFEITSAIYVDLKETLKEQITNTLGGKIVFIAGPRKIVTLKIVLQRKRQIEKSPTHPQHHILWPEMLQPVEDFSAYPSMPVVTCVDIAREEQRAREIADQLENATQRVVAIEKDLKEKQNPAQARFEAELQLARGDVATFERSLLEAQLSVILSKKKFNELNQKSEVFPLNVDEIRSKCRGIGVRLNMARIRKRIYDYITEYYNQ